MPQHGERDGVYDEDRSPIRTGQGPRVMASCRHTALSLFHRLRVPNLEPVAHYLPRHPDHGADALRGV